jgi:RimJ/RimL family protein N-acetyltransferase
VGNELFSKYAQATREAIAKAFGVPISAFDSEQLTFVDRQDSIPVVTLKAITFGTGTVISIDPAYRQFAEANAPAKHYRAMSVPFLRSIVEEGKRRGEELEVRAPGLGFTIGTEPPYLTVPAGFQLREHDTDWMAAEQQNGRFENGVGEPGDRREFTNRFALAFYDDAGSPAAVAGAFETYGMIEIGIDVARPYRGRGLGRLAVSTLAREIMRRAEVPFYSCPPTNIRSHRTAESSGFRPVMSAAAVAPAG